MIGLEGKTLTSCRLTYRLLEDGDRQALATLLADPAVTEPGGFRPARTEAEFDEFYRGLTAYHTGVAILREGALIGYICVGPWHPDDAAYAGKTCVSFGFVIGKAAQGHGYGAEALETMTAYMKGRADFCFADHFEGNEPSRKTILKCGYRFCGCYTMFFEALGREERCLSYVF